ncbi:MAG: hypothetical protein RR757_06590, partial [Raoultibacter sp.]
IILVLVAIAIPVFTGAMASAEKAVDEANMRSIKGVVSVECLLTDKEKPVTYYYVDKNNDLIEAGTDKNKIPAGTKYAYFAQAFKNPDATMFVEVEKYQKK